jgi:hypothetical protein
MRAKSLSQRIYQVLAYEYSNLTCWHLKLVHSWRLWILFYPTSFLVNCYPQTCGGKWMSSRVKLYIDLIVNRLSLLVGCYAVRMHSQCARWELLLVICVF